MDNFNHQQGQRRTFSQLLITVDNIIGIKETKKQSCKRRCTIDLDANDINSFQKAHKVLAHPNDDNVILFIFFFFLLSTIPRLHPNAATSPAFTTTYCISLLTLLDGFDVEKMIILQALETLFLRQSHL